MDISSFFSRDDLRVMQTAVKTEEKFEIRKQFRTSRNSYTITIHSAVINDDLAHDIWHDHNYLIHFSEEHSGTMGWGGFGFATADLSIFRDWDSFKEWVDHSMRRYSEYDTEELEQLSLFECD